MRQTRVANAASTVRSTSGLPAAGLRSGYDEARRLAPMVAVTTGQRSAASAGKGTVPALYRRAPTPSTAPIRGTSGPVIGGSGDTSRFGLSAAPTLHAHCGCEGEGKCGCGDKRPGTCGCGSAPGRVGSGTRSLAQEATPSTHLAVPAVDARFGLGHVNVCGSSLSSARAAAPTYGPVAQGARPGMSAGSQGPGVAVPPSASKRRRVPRRLGSVPSAVPFETAARVSRHLVNARLVATPSPVMRTRAGTPVASSQSGLATRRVDSVVTSARLNSIGGSVAASRTQVAVRGSASLLRQDHLNLTMLEVVQSTMLPYFIAWFAATEPTASPEAVLLRAIERNAPEPIPEGGVLGALTTDVDLLRAFVAVARRRSGSADARANDWRSILNEAVREPLHVEPLLLALIMQAALARGGATPHLRPMGLPLVGGGSLNLNPRPPPFHAPIDVWRAAWARREKAGGPMWPATPPDAALLKAIIGATRSMAPADSSPYTYVTLDPADVLREAHARLKVSNVEVPGTWPRNIHHELLRGIVDLAVAMPDADNLDVYTRAWERLTRLGVAVPPRPVPSTNLLRALVVSARRLGSIDPRAVLNESLSAILEWELGSAMSLDIEPALLEDVIHAAHTLRGADVEAVWSEALKLRAARDDLLWPPKPTPDEPLFRALIYFARRSTDDAAPGVILDAALSALGRASSLEQINRVRHALRVGQISASGAGCKDHTGDEVDCESYFFLDPRGWAAWLSGDGPEKTWNCIKDIFWFWNGIRRHCTRDDDDEKNEPDKVPMGKGKDTGEDPGLGSGSGSGGGTGTGGGPEPGPAPPISACTVQGVSVDASIGSLAIRTRQTGEGLTLERPAAGEIVIKWRPIVVQWPKMPRVALPLAVARLVSAAGQLRPILACFILVGDEPLEDAPPPNLNRCLNACAGGRVLREAFCRSMWGRDARNRCWAKVLRPEQECRNWCYDEFTQ